MTLRGAPIRVRPACAALWLVLAAVPDVANAESASTGDSAWVAGRAAQPPRIDGNLGDEPWTAATPYDGFFRVFPPGSQAPTERTEVRFLVDDRTLYVSVLCLDREPSSIDVNVGKRDAVSTAADSVSLYLDSRHDHLNAVFFTVSAGGSVEDGLITGDNVVTRDWDGVWEAATSVREDGWAAELAIPLRLLSFEGGKPQLWGVGVQRVHPRTHETQRSQPILRQSNAFVSRLGHLALPEVTPGADWDLTPYVATRLAFAPASRDPLKPLPRIGYPSADVGLDFKASVANDTRIVATLNPDFGQVEADVVSLNLTTQELFYPERRPFFTEGLALFQPTGADQAPQRLVAFYTRRVGAEAPILAAAKVTGVAGSVQFGAVEALTYDAWQPPPPEGAVDRSLSWHPERPFHLTTNQAVRSRPVSPRNFFSATARTQVRDQTFGLTYVHSIPLTTVCGEEEGEAPGCEFGSHVAALSYHLRSPGSEWMAVGEVQGSLVTQGPSGSRLPDGTRLRRNDGGFGTYVTAGKLGGEPWRLFVTAELTTPTFELNRAGFNALQNNQTYELTALHKKPGGFGFIVDTEWKTTARQSFTLDARAVPRGLYGATSLAGTLPGYHRASLMLELADDQFDLREIPGTGIALQRGHAAALTVALQTDPTRDFSLEASFSQARLLPRGVYAGGAESSGSLSLVLRPQRRLESQVNVSGGWRPYPPKLIGTEGPDTLRFAVMNVVCSLSPSGNNSC
jgi:hypothetical protein